MDIQEAAKLLWDENKGIRRKRWPKGSHWMMSEDPLMYGDIIMVNGVIEVPCVLSIKELMADDWEEY